MNDLQDYKCNRINAKKKSQKKSHKSEINFADS